MIKRLWLILSATILMVPAATMAAEYDIWTNFEDWVGYNYQPIEMKITGFIFETTAGTPIYFADMNAKVLGNRDWYSITSVDTQQVSGNGEYFIQGQVAAYCLDGYGKITFERPARQIRIGYSSFFDIFLDCYDENGTLLDTIFGSPNTLTQPEGSPGTGLVYLNVIRPDFDTKYVIIRSEPGYWLIDDLRITIPEPSGLFAFAAAAIGLGGLILKRKF